MSHRIVEAVLGNTVFPHASVVRSGGPERLVDDGKHNDELPDGRDFIGFGEGLS